MASYDVGKKEVVSWIHENFPKDSTILDVGACDGKWRQLLRDYVDIDAVDIWEPNCRNIKPMYRNVFCKDITTLKYLKYDLIIFGDVIEHMEVADAQKALKYAMNKCKDMIVAVPYRYPQGELYGNPYERHIQDDLTPEIFAERYPDLEVLINPGHNYCFYHKKPKTKARQKK